MVPIISLIIPVYNLSQYLENGFHKLKALYNKLDESQFEILYINDGSTDNSLEILNKLGNQYSNIKIISQENQGLSGARNAGIKNAIGEYIHFLDADDYLNIENFTEVLFQIQKLNLDLISFRLIKVDEHENILNHGEKQALPHNVIMSGKKALINDYTPTSSCLFIYRREFLTENNLYFVLGIYHEDEEYMVRIMLSAEKIMFRDIFVYYYLQRSGSIMNPSKQEKMQKLLWDEIIVAFLIKQNFINLSDENLKLSIIKNYNNIVWNLLWRFSKNRDEVSSTFKKECLNELKSKNLYPIKGPLKTNFQYLTRVIFNTPIFAKYLFKI